MASCLGGSPAGRGASQLRAALIDRLDPTDEQGSLNEAILKGIASCDRFLCRGKPTHKGLQKLQQSIESQFICTFGAQHCKREKSTPAKSSLSSTAAEAQQPGTAAGLDWTMPPLLLQKKAFIQGGDFDKMAILQDAWAKKDDRAREANRRMKMETQRAVLDSQRREMDLRREEARLEKEDEKQQLEASILEYERAAKEELIKKKERQLATRKLFSEQIQAREEATKRAKEQELRDNAIQKQRLRDETRKETEVRENQSKTYRTLVKQAQEENRAKFAEKEQMQAEIKAEETRYNNECMRISEEREAKRAHQVEAIMQRQRLMTERGGGPGLQKSLEEHMRLDELRMEKVQQEYEQKREALDAARKREEQQRAADTVAMLDQQVLMKKTRMLQEAAEKEQQQHQMSKTICQEVEQEKRNNAMRKKTQRNELLELKKRMETEAQQRFLAWQESMNEVDKKIHKNVVNGKQRGFTTLPCLDSF